MATERYCFGSFDFDLARLCLRSGPQTVSLPRKSLETLRVLVRRRGETVTRQELFDEVWADSFVEDANLTVAVSHLRKALAEFDGEHNYIHTVPTRGYKFVGDPAHQGVAEQRTLLIDRQRVEHVTMTRSLVFGRGKLVVAVALGLLITFTAGAAWMLKGPDTNSRAAAAADAYRRGKELLEKRRVCDSIPHLREALINDNSIAEAHADLASALAMCDITPEADVEIDHARALAPSSPNVLAVDGFLRMFRKWDWRNAESELRRSVALAPTSARNHHWLGVYLSIQGWFPEAEGEMRRAIELEPESPLYHADLAQVYYFTGDAELANTEAKAALALDPSFFFASSYLRDLALASSDQATAFRYELNRRSVMGTAPEELQRVEQIYKQSGFNGVVQDDIDRIENQWREKSFDPHGECGLHFQLAYNYAALRDRERTLTELETALDTDAVSRPFPMAYVAVDPRYSFLKGDERYGRILSRMGLRD